MNMDYEHSMDGNPSVRPTIQPRKRTKGRYLKQTPKNAHHRRRRRRKLNPRFVILVAVLVAILLGIILGIRSCTKPTIVGRWDLDGTTVYEFHKDGTGALVLMIGEYEFNYEIRDNVLQIDFIDDEVALDATYTFELQKDVLFLTGGPGDSRMEYVLRRKG